jgi:hypothetical protein
VNSKAALKNAYCGGKAAAGVRHAVPGKAYIFTYVFISYTKAGKSVKWLERPKAAFEANLREFSVNFKAQSKVQKGEKKNMTKTELQK